MAFRIGQKVQCIKNGKWRDLVGLADPPWFGPQAPEVVTIVEIEYYHGETFLVFVEHPAQNSFLSDYFRPLVSTNIDIFHSILANPHRELETCE